jgi:hypothetical protein
MNEPTCQTVQEQIDLYVAQECDPSARTAIARHLESCAACTQAYRDAQELLGLLDVHYQAPARLERLGSQLDVEAQRRRSRFRLSPVALRAAALAALLLLMVGVYTWLEPGLTRHRPPESMIAMDWQPMQRGGPDAEADTIVRSLTRPKHGLEMVPAPPNGHPAVVRGQHTDKAPPVPPIVNMGLELRNTSDQEIRIRIGAPESELQIVLEGPGVKTLPARDGLGEAFLTVPDVTLAAGQSHILPIRRLVFGKRGAVEYAYWTQPGEYTLTARYRTLVAAAPYRRWETATFSSPPLKVRVEP